MTNRDSTRAALVTGGARGIGRAIVEALLADGYAVAFIDIDAEAGRRTAAELGGQGAVRFVEGDVADDAAVQGAVETAVAAFGGLSLVVNNTGIGRGGPVESLSLADWNRVLAVNLTSIFLTTRSSVEYLRRSRGAIVNIASTRALQSEANTEAYSASKGGIVALTHALAVSLGPDVRVNCISPGWIHTGTDPLSAADHAQHPCGRVGKPDDIAAAVVYLASERAGFITGQNLVIDGGMTRKMIYEDLVNGRDDRVVISRRGKPVACVVPLKTGQTANRIGIARGQFDVPDDIDCANPQIASLFGKADASS